MSRILPPPPKKKKLSDSDQNIPPQKWKLSETCQKVFGTLGLSWSKMAPPPPPPAQMKSCQIQGLWVWMAQNTRSLENEKICQKGVMCGAHPSTDTILFNGQWKCQSDLLDNFVSKYIQVLGVQISQRPLNILFFTKISLRNKLNKIVHHSDSLLDTS